MQNQSNDPRDILQITPVSPPAVSSTTSYKRSGTAASTGMTEPKTSFLTSTSAVSTTIHWPKQGQLRPESS